MSGTRRRRALNHHARAGMTGPSWNKKKDWCGVLKILQPQKKCSHLHVIVLIIRHESLVRLQRRVHDTHDHRNKLRAPPSDHCLLFNLPRERHVNHARIWCLNHRLNAIVYPAQTCEHVCVDPILSASCLSTSIIQEIHDKLRSARFQIYNPHQEKSVVALRMPLELRARRNTCSISSGSTLFAALCTHLLLYHTINGEAFSKNYRAAHTDQNETWRRNTPTDRTHTTGKCFALCIAVCNAFHGGVYVCNTRPKALCPAQTPQRHSARDDGSCEQFPAHSHRQAS